MNSVEIFNIRVDEPIVTLTDLFVTAVSFYAFFKIHKNRRTAKTFTFFKYYFLLMGIATALGGIVGHAFLYALSFGWKLPGWIVSMLSIALIERAAIEHSGGIMTKKFFRALKIINIVELTGFIVVSMFTLNFFYVEAHSAYGLMFVVLSLEVYIFYKVRAESSKYIIFGIVGAAVAALFFMFEISAHKWFNYLSISHTFMAIASWLIYKGVMKISDAGTYETD